MEDREIMLTQEGYKKLVEELQYLKGPRKMEVAERIKIAREFGDLSENSEYEEAKNEQALLETKIAEMEATVRNAKVVADHEISTKEAGVGTQVTVYDYEFDEEITYSIVGATEVNIAENKIANESPVGSALIGKKVGDIVEVAVPDGISKFEVLDIRRV